MAENPLRSDTDERSGNASLRQPRDGTRVARARLLRVVGDEPRRADEEGPPRSAPRLPPRRRRVRWLAVAAALIAALALLAVAVALFIDEPLRRRMERDINSALDGYTVHIGALAFHPLGFSLDLLDSSIVQSANPDPPVARIARLHASVHWRALLHGRLVADFLFERPVLHVDLTQARHEANDDVRLANRGWQEAAQRIYPLKIDLLRVVDGDLTYTDRGPFTPLHVTGVNFRADNIRNVRSRDRDYPSEVHLDAVVFGTGTLRADGHADFLAEPYAGMDTFFHLEQLPLRPFTALIGRYASIRGGVLSAAGELEYAPRIARVDLKDLAVDGVEADYIRTIENEAAEARDTEQAIEAAKQASNAPSLQLQAEQIRIRHGTLGFVNRASEPAYRLFLADAGLTIRRFSNQATAGPSFAELRGRFMGSGDTLLRVRFQPRTQAPDFDLDASVEHADLRSVNDLLRARGNFDVASGELSVYSALRVRHLMVDGYVKPLLKGVRVYDAQQDREKPFFHRLYERLVGLAARFLESRQRSEVATKVDLSGPLTAPRTSTWQIVGRLLRNAIIAPITPGLEETPVGEVATASSSSPARTASSPR